jgi:hypothetical protein
MVELGERTGGSICQEVLRACIMGHRGESRTVGTLSHSQRPKELTSDGGSCFVCHFGGPTDSGGVVRPDGRMTVPEGSEAFGYEVLEQHCCHFQV